MSEIKQYIENIPDSHLVSIVNEVLVCYDVRVLQQDAKIAYYITQLMTRFGVNRADAVMIIRSGCVRLAAKKWADSQPKERSI